MIRKERISAGYGKKEDKKNKEAKKNRKNERKSKNDTYCSIIVAF